MAREARKGFYLEALASERHACRSERLRRPLQKFESHREASLKCAGFEGDPKGLSKFLLEFEVESVR